MPEVGRFVTDPRALAGTLAELKTRRTGLVHGFDVARIGEPSYRGDRGVS